MPPNEDPGDQADEGTIVAAQDRNAADIGSGHAVGELADQLVVVADDQLPIGQHLA